VLQEFLFNQNYVPRLRENSYAALVDNRRLTLFKRDSGIRIETYRRFFPVPGRAALVLNVPVARLEGRP
jgi:hypothetical protein